MIKLDNGQRVRVNCPSPQKYPNFSSAFHGKLGKASNIKGHDDLASVSLDVPPNQPAVDITVQKDWLSHA